MKKTENTVSSAADRSHVGIVQSQKPKRQFQAQTTQLQPLPREPEGTDILFYILFYILFCIPFYILFYVLFYVLSCIQFSILFCVLYYILFYVLFYILFCTLFHVLSTFHCIFYSFSVACSILHSIQSLFCSIFCSVFWLKTVLHPQEGGRQFRDPGGWDGGVVHLNLRPPQPRSGAFLAPASPPLGRGRPP